MLSDELLSLPIASRRVAMFLMLLPWLLGRSVRGTSTMNGCAIFNSTMKFTVLFKLRTHSHNTLLVPSPSETWFWGISVGGSFRRVYDWIQPQDATNWLSSRFSRSVETQRRFGWLKMIYTRCASSELQCCVLREMVARERQGALSREAWYGEAVRASVPWHALSGE